MKKLWAAVLSLTLLFSLAGCAGAGTEGQDSPVAGRKVAYIMQMKASDIFLDWSQGAREMAEALGMDYNVFFCDGSDQAWQDMITQCAQEGYDGLLLSHGGSSDSYAFLSQITQAYPDLKIVTFDTQFLDEKGEAAKLEGVTQFFQQDAQLAALLLDYLCEELYPEKVQAGEPVNVLKVWVGPGFLSAFDRREEGYATYERQGLIHTLETIGPADFADAESSMKEVTAEALARYGEGEIDAIWCCYDLYANGVYEALREGGYDIPLVTVDICNADIEKMAAQDSPWQACATTNWRYNGEFGMRVLALELAGEYDRIVDPSTGEVSDWLELPTSLVTQEMVAGGNVDISNLGEVAGAAYNDRSWMPTTDWME